MRSAPALVSGPRTKPLADRGDAGVTDGRDEVAPRHQLSAAVLDVVDGQHRTGHGAKQSLVRFSRGQVGEESLGE